MKKFIYAISFLAIALAFSGTSVLAQSGTKIDADIPFDFTIGGKTLAAGKYTMFVRKNNSGAEQIELRDSKFHIVYEGFMLQNGDRSTGRSELIFDRVAGQPVLAKIRLENKGIAVPVEKDPSVTLAAKERKKLGGSSN